MITCEKIEEGCQAAVAVTAAATAAAVDAVAAAAAAVANGGAVLRHNFGGHVVRGGSVLRDYLTFPLGPEIVRKKVG